VTEAWVERFDDTLMPHREAGADPTRLRSLLDDYHRAVSPAEAVPGTADIRAGLRALGYGI
jgi:hypothetical protein